MLLYKRPLLHFEEFCESVVSCWYLDNDSGEYLHHRNGQTCKCKVPRLKKWFLNNFQCAGKISWYSNYIKVNLPYILHSEDLLSDKNDEKWAQTLYTLIANDSQ